MYTTKRNRFLHRKTLKNYKQKPKVIIGLVYANWCGHCQLLKPEWKNMKSKLKSSKLGNKHHFVEIEDSDHKKDKKINKINTHIKNGSKLRIEGYPTIFKIKGGNLEYYKGGRNSDEMFKWFSGGQNQQPELKQQLQKQPQKNMINMFGGDCGCSNYNSNPLKNVF
jgi:thiol-disulfide isomerase/thioredoxin